jgi:hypothetical protein
MNKQQQRKAVRELLDELLCNGYLEYTGGVDQRGNKLMRATAKGFEYFDSLFTGAALKKWSLASSKAVAENNAFIAAHGERKGAGIKGR